MIERVLQFLFPPLCLECQEPTDLAYFCIDCWQRSGLIEVAGRCRHCFELMEEEKGVCRYCKNGPLFPFTRAALFEREAPMARLLRREESVKAVAGFAYYQWTKLEWKKPDFVVPVEGSPIAEALAEVFGVPTLSLLRRAGWPLEEEQWEVCEEFELDEATLLLFEEGHSLKQLHQIGRAVQEAFPKKVYLLSLLA